MSQYIKRLGDQPEEEKANTFDEYMVENDSRLIKQGVSINEFKVLDAHLGRGTFGLVKLVEREGKRYAMKQLVKDEITKVCFLS